MDLNYAYFCFKGSSDISEITNLLNLQPTRSWNIGDKRENGSTYSFSFWSYERKEFEKDFIDQSIEEVINFIEKNSLDFGSLSKKFEIYISCVGYHKKSFSGFFLSKETIEKLARLGLAVDFDLYCKTNTEGF